MRPGVLPMTRKQSDRVLNGLVRHPFGRRNWNSKGPASRLRWYIFFDSQDLVHKEFVPEGRIVNAEFYKGVMDRLLKRIQRVRPAAFCCRDFFLLHNNAPPTKLQTFANFLFKKCYNPLSPPVLSRFISARLFSVPQVENEVKRIPLCGCSWDPRNRNWWIKEGPKRGDFGSFSETVRPRTSLYICNWSLFWIKKGMCLPLVPSMFKKYQS